jgi:hypothetical protein
VAVHALARVNATRVGTGANRTVLTVRLGTVRHQTASETVALDGALETLTNAASADIHLITLLEKLSRLQLSANLKRRGVTKAEFLQVTHRRSARLFAVTDLRLGDLILANDVVPNLDGVVTIRRFGLDLCVRELNVIPSSVVAFRGVNKAVSFPSNLSLARALPSLDRRDPRACSPLHSTRARPRVVRTDADPETRAKRRRGT